MLSRLLIATATLVMSASLAWAGSFAKFDQSAFDAAQKAGKSIVLHVHADWCPTCKAQFPILDELRADERLQQVSFVRVDFDDNGEFLRKYRVPRQSTILLFRGGREVARSIAETDRDRLRAFVLDGFVE